MDHHVLEGVHYQQDSIILHVMEMRADLLIAQEIQIMGVVKMLECYAVSVVAEARKKTKKQLIIDLSYNLPLHSINK